MSKELTHADMNPSAETFRCNERLFGCQQVKAVGDFGHQRSGGRLNPDLCDSCITHMQVTFGVSRNQVEALIVVRADEHSLICGAKVFARRDGRDIVSALNILKADKIARLRRYTLALLDAFTKEGQPGVLRVWKAYQKWWMDQVGMDWSAKPKEQIATVALNVASAALPVGDRA